MAIRFDHKPGLVVYLTAGDPTLEATRAIAVAAIDAGADVIELGVPFSDPLGDGPVIQRAMERAVARKTSLADVLARRARNSLRASRMPGSSSSPISIPSCAMAFRASPMTPPPQAPTACWSST